MPRSKGDHEARRRELSEAVWRVLAARGFGGLTLRAVAADMGATTGLLTHYFPAKRDLVAYALDLLEQRTADRSTRRAEVGLPAVRAALLDVLPLTAASIERNRIWVSSWDVALADLGRSEKYAGMYGRSRDKLQALFAAAQELGDLPERDPAQEAARALSFALGLVVQALLDPAAFPPARQKELLDGYLGALV